MNPQAHFLDSKNLPDWLIEPYRDYVRAFLPFLREKMGRVAYSLTREEDEEAFNQAATALSELIGNADGSQLDEALQRLGFDTEFKQNGTLRDKKRQLEHLLHQEAEIFVRKAVDLVSPLKKVAAGR